MVMSFGALLFICSVCVFIIVKRRNENEGITSENEGVANAIEQEMVPKQDTVPIASHEEDIDQEDDDDNLYKMAELTKQNENIVHERTTNDMSSDGAKDGENEGYNKYNRIEQILKAIYEDESDNYLKRFVAEMVTDAKVFEDIGFMKRFPEEGEFWNELLPQK